MAKEYVYIRGKFKWFRHKTLNKFGAWSHDIYPADEEELKKINDLKDRGLLNKLRKDDDGYYMTFKCEPEKKSRAGKIMRFEQPVVTDKDGQPLGGDTMIGNGSDGITKLEVYTYPTMQGNKGCAARWMASRIDNLVPFDKEKDFTEIEEKKVRGLDDVPPQPSW